MASDETFRDLEPMAPVERAQIFSGLERVSSKIDILAGHIADNTRVHAEGIKTMHDSLKPLADLPKAFSHSECAEVQVITQRVSTLESSFQRETKKRDAREEKTIDLLNSMVLKFELQMTSVMSELSSIKKASDNSVSGFRFWITPVLSMIGSVLAALIVAWAMKH